MKLKTSKAIDLAGSAKTLADLLGITQSAVSQWGDDLPQARVWQLMTLKPEWFKPDVEWSVLRGTQPEAA